MVFGYSKAQETELNLTFLSDSAKVGMPFEVAISIEYNKYIDILLPDSTYNFAPFEYVSRRYFPTSTSGSVSEDSVIYTLRTFSLDSVILLSMDLYEVIDGDSLLLSTNFDSIKTNFIVTSVPDSINSLFLKETANYYRIPRLFNYPYFIVGATIFIILLSVLWLAFGEKIKRYIAIRRLNKQYEIYQHSFDNELSVLTEENRFKQTEKLLKLWKTYMENLENIPYSKLTTKEISKLKQDHLNKILEKLDEVIYSKKSKVTSQKSLEELRNYSSEAFSDKLNKLKHGIQN